MHAAQGPLHTRKVKKISLYNHFSLVRENHHRGEYHTSSYKEGSLFIDQFKATQKRPYWYDTHKKQLPWQVFESTSQRGYLYEIEFIE